GTARKFWFCSQVVPLTRRFAPPSPVGRGTVLDTTHPLIKNKRHSDGEGVSDVRFRNLATVFALATLIVVMSGVSISALLPQNSAGKGNGADWPRYAGDLAGTRFSTLKQINAQNVATLMPAWTITGVGSQETPIVVNGILYASTSTGVVAVEADSGKE